MKRIHFFICLNILSFSLNGMSRRRVRLERLTQGLDALAESLANLGRAIKGKFTPDIKTEIIAQQDNIIQYRVLQQKRPADCGYHALKNGIAAINGIINHQSFIENAIDKNYYENKFNNWQEKIKQARLNIIKKYNKTIEEKKQRIQQLEKNKPENFKNKIQQERNALVRIQKNFDENKNWLQSNDWLQGDELDFLIQKASNQYMQTITNPSDYFTVLDDATWLDPQNNYFGISENIVKVIKDFRNKSSFTHAYLMRTPGSGGTHWYTLIVKKENGQTHFILLDSLNKNRITKPEVKQLISALRSGNIKAMEQTFKTNLKPSKPSSRNETPYVYTPWQEKIQQEQRTP